MQVEKIAAINSILIWCNTAERFPLDKGSIIIESLDFINNPLEHTKGVEGIVVLCELSRNEKGEPVSLCDFYGVRVVQMLRRNGVTHPIVFTSFSELKKLIGSGENNADVANNGRRAIINSIGHGFVQLPCKPEEWLTRLREIENLSELELYDVVNSYCLDTGIILNLMHSLHGGVPIAELRDKIRTAISQVNGIFSFDATVDLHDFDKQFPVIDESNRRAAIHFAEETGNRLIEQYLPEEGKSSKSRIEGKWKLLLLEDEMEDHHPFIEKLKARGVTVLIARTALEAEEMLEDDFRGENRILVVVSDYRLEEVRDGVAVHQPKQGYSFLKDLSLKESYIRLVALSALPRKFLMQSFKHYGVRVDIFSKKDYLENDSTIELLCEELVEIGNESAEAVTRLPRFSSGEWALFEPFYAAYRNSVTYKEDEFTISRRAKEYCAGIKTGKYPFQLEGYTVKLEGAKKTIDNPKTIKEFLGKMVARRVAIWYSQYYKDWRLTDIHRAIKGDLYTGEETEAAAKNQINTNLALSLKEYPWNMTIEEKHWMMYEMGFGDVERIEQQENQLVSAIAEKIVHWIKANPATQLQLDKAHINTFGRIRGRLNEVALGIHENRELLGDFIKLVSACKGEITKRIPDYGKRTPTVSLFGKYLHLLRNRIRKIQKAPIEFEIGDEEWENLKERVTKLAFKRVSAEERPLLEGTACIFFHDLKEKGIAYDNDNIYMEKLLKENQQDLFAAPSVSFEDWMSSSDFHATLEDNTEGDFTGSRNNVFNDHED